MLVPSLHHLSCILGSPSGQVDYHDEDLLAECADGVVLGCFEGGGDTTRRSLNIIQLLFVNNCRRFGLVWKETSQDVLSLQTVLHVKQ